VGRGFNLLGEEVKRNILGEDDATPGRKVGRHNRGKRKIAPSTLRKGSERNEKPCPYRACKEAKKGKPVLRRGEKARVHSCKEKPGWTKTPRRRRRYFGGES